MNIKSKIINNVPNMPFLIKAVTKAKIQGMRNKLISDELVQKAEKDTELKDKLVREYLAKLKVEKRIELQNTIDKLIKEGYAKDIEDQNKMRVDILFCIFAYGFMADEYFYFTLKNKSYSERKSYVSNDERRAYIIRMNQFSMRDIFNDKARTYEVFHKYYKREAVTIQSRKDFMKFQAFVEKHPVFVSKKVDESSGNTVELVDIYKTSQIPEDFFKSTIAKGKYILEEKV